MNPLFLRSQLFDTAGDASGGGGGGSSTAGTGDSSAAGGGAAAPSYITMEATQKLINDAVSGVAKRLTGEHQKTYGELKAQFDALRPKQDDSSQSQQQPGGQQKTAAEQRAEMTERDLRAEIAKVKKQSEETEKARQATEESSRKTTLDSKLTQALSKLDLIDGAVGDAFVALRPALKMTEDGQIVAGDAELPIEQFIVDAMKSRSYMFKPQSVGGTGGAVRGGASGGSGYRPVDTTEIGPKMSAERREQAYKEALALAWQR
jgi:hypothetical protein